MNSHEGMEQANATSSEALSPVVVVFCLGCCGSVFLPNWIRHFKIPPLALKNITRPVPASLSDLCISCWTTSSQLLHPARYSD